MAKRPYRQGARAVAAQQTRAAILDAAARAFAGGAYDAVSLERIAAAASVTVQTVLRLFGSKDGLFEAAAERALAELGAERDAAVDERPRSAIATMCRMYERWGEATHRVLAQEDRVPSIRRVAARGRAHHRRWVRALFAKKLRGAAKQRRLALLTALLELESYRRLRALGLGPRAACDALHEAVVALLR